MDAESAYTLLDAGDGRRLERFGDRIVDRPAPAAIDPQRDPRAWSSAHLRFDREAGWKTRKVKAEPWTIDLDGMTFELRPTDAGQLGLFPEQAPNWTWLGQRAGESSALVVDPPRFLNLFGYTGASTIAAAGSGAAVVHVDGSKPSVAWARRNAELSGVTDRPIRWLVDGVEAFVGREIRRGHQYEGIILDPPSYGHGAGGRAWRLEERLTPLLASCAELTGDDPALVLVTAHTPGFGPDRLAAELGAAFGRPEGQVDAGELALEARSGAILRLGSFARIMRG